MFEMHKEIYETKSCIRTTGRGWIYSIYAISPWYISQEKVVKVVVQQSIKEDILEKFERIKS
jgi:hypothetical protein